MIQNVFSMKETLEIILLLRKIYAHEGHVSGFDVNQKIDWHSAEINILQTG